MAKPIQVQLSFIYGRLQKLIDLGREHRWQNRSGELKNATIAMKIIDFILDLRHDDTYSRILNHERCNFLTLITRSLHEYATRHGYMRKSTVTPQRKQW